MNGIPPQAIEIEKSVLGTLISYKDAFEDANLIISKDVFYKQEHIEIYEAMSDLLKENRPIDLLTVSNKLKETKKLDKIGGTSYLTQLMYESSTSAYLEVHCRILQEKYLKREIINRCSNLVSMAYDDDNDVFDMTDKVYSELEKISDFKQVNEDWKTKVEKHSIYNDHNGIESTFNKLNEKGKYNNSDMVVIGARPGMGKTAFIVSEMLGMMKKGVMVGLFSFEMTTVQMINRILSSELRIDLENISDNSNKNPRLTQSEIEEIEKFKKNNMRFYPLMIDEHSRGLNQFKIKAKKMYKAGVQIIFVDYLQLMSVSNMKQGTNREQEIGTISREIKALAKELNIPIIVLSQLSRKVEERADKRPITSDLRESGAIEQDADKVCFIFRPEYYGMDLMSDNETPSKNLSEFIITKNRQGKIGTTLLGADMRYTRFFNLEESEIMPNNDLDMAF